MRRRTFLRALGAGAGAAALGATTATTADAGGYLHRRTVTRIPARTWVRLGAVDAGATRYGAQLVVRGGPRVVRIRFYRETPGRPRDGTGDQTYLVGRVSPFNITHWHEVKRFPGRMAVYLWADRPVSLAYVILKARG